MGLRSRSWLAFARIGWGSYYARIAYSIIILGLLLAFIQPRRISETLLQLDFFNIVGALALIVVSQYLSSVRLYGLLRDNNIHVPRHEVYRANVYSLVGGMLFFNIFGQGITRSLLLNKYNVPQSTVFVLTALERIAALFVLLIASFVSVFVLFRRFPVSFDIGSLHLLVYALSAASAFGFAYLLGLTKRQRRLFRLLVGGTFSRATASLLVVTILMHGATLAAYVLIGANLMPTARIDLLMAASVIIMLLASMPISFAGWGFRELSASVVFARLGFAPEQGFVLGIVIGVMSVVALMSQVGWLGLRKIESVGADIPESSGVDTAGLERAAYWLIGLGTAAAALFSIRVPTNTGELNVNIGDPIAIIGGIVLLGLAWQTRVLARLWRVRGMVLSIALITLVLALGLLRGYLAYGPIDWAIFNRFLGWFLLLAYFGTGTLMVTTTGQVGFATLCRVLCAAAASIVAFGIIVDMVSYFAPLSDILIVRQRAQGMAGNPNAFAFQLIMAFAALMATTDFYMGRKRAVITTLLAGFLMAGIWLTASRAGAGAMVLLIIVILAIFRRRIDLVEAGMKLGFGLLMAIGLLALATALTAGLLWIIAIEPPAVIHGSDFFHPGFTTVFQSDRRQSIEGGLAMWAAYPIFGGGLGAFIYQHIQSTGIVLVIHNSALWIVAELGIVGLIAYAIPVLAIAKSLHSDPEWSDTGSKILVAGVFLTLLVMGSVHDMLYQRLFWLLLGAGLAVPCAFTRFGGRPPQLRQGDPTA